MVISNTRKTKEEWENIINDWDNGSFEFLNWVENKSMKARIRHKECKEIFEIYVNSFVDSQRVYCRHCGKHTRLKTKEKFQEEINDKYGKNVYVLTGEYKGSKGKTTFYCTKCNEEIFTTPEQILLRGCPNCGKKRRSEKTILFNKENKRLSKEEIKNRFEIWNDELEWKMIGEPTPSKNKANGFYEITIQCNNCGNITSQGTDCILRRNYKCKYCKGRHISEKEAKEIIKEKSNGNIEIVKYNGWTQNGELLCLKHNNCYKVNTIKSASTQKFLGCAECNRENKSGENNWAWKGGASLVSNYFRGCIFAWIGKSYAAYNNCSVITGNTDNLVIHHCLFSFYQVVEDVLKENNINYEFTNKAIKDFYSGDKDENLLRILGEQIRKRHFALGWGVPIENNLHNEFHSKYGKINNTPEQFIEFAKSKGVNLKIENRLLVQSNY